MPVLSHHAPPDVVTPWFRLPAGQALLDSERTAVADALAAHPVIGLPWLWLAPAASEGEGETPVGRGLRLCPDADGLGAGGWHGAVRCRLPLPLASESLGAVVLQHATGPDRAAAVALIEECARVLVPGGRLALLALNPLSPYRLRWRGRGLSAEDPSTWRRLLGDAGLVAETDALGLGPQWSPTASPSLQSGPGLRAAYLLRAEKRAVPMTPIRPRLPLAIADGVPVA
jgi:SAM-dependent methyltransferase